MTLLAAPIALLTTVGLGLALSQTVSAQSGDRQYCDALIQMYRSYISDPNQGRQQRAPDVGPEVAISKCRAGDTAAGIPTLEKALRDARINLPSRG